MTPDEEAIPNPAWKELEKYPLVGYFFNGVEYMEVYDSTQKPIETKKDDPQ